MRFQNFNLNFLKTFSMSCLLSFVLLIYLTEFDLGVALTELSREKTSQKQVENNTHQFLKSLGTVESKLTEQINYLTQVSTGELYR